MLHFRHTRKALRPYFLCSLSGAALMFAQPSLYAQHSLKPAPRNTLVPAATTEMRSVEAPSGLSPIVPSSGELFRHGAAGASAPQSPVLQMPQGVAGNQGSNSIVTAVQVMPIHAPHLLEQTPGGLKTDDELLQVQYQSDDPSIIQRISRPFRGTRVSAPVDPGMDYPKAPKSLAPPPAPGVSLGGAGSDQSLQAIPVISATQPGLLVTPDVANPISSLIPPAPDRAGAATGRLSNLPPLPSESPQQIRNVAELKMIMQPPEPVQHVPVITRSQQQVFVPPPLEPAGASSRSSVVAILPQQKSNSMPSLDFQAPINVNQKPIAPGEPVGMSTKPHALTVALPPAPAERQAQRQVESIASVPPAPKSVIMPPSPDSTGDFFPDDKKTVAVTPTPAAPAAPAAPALPAAPTVPPEVSGGGSLKPYTGLTLDDVAPQTNGGTLDLRLPEMPSKPLPSMVVADNSSNSLAMPDAPTLKLEAVPAPELPMAKSGGQSLAKTRGNDLVLPDLPSAPGQLKVDTQQKQLDVPVASSEKSQDPRSKLELIAARKNQPGLKGFCAVKLRDDRDLVDSRAEYAMNYADRQYQFSSQEALERFKEEPLKYAPASSGSDVIHLALTGEKMEGSLDNAVWYKGRLYLFATVETMDTFVAAPSSHASND